MRRFAFVVFVLSLAAPSVSLAAPAWRNYTTHGFVVSVPSNWRVVPTSRVRTLALANHLGASGQRKLAIVYRSIANDPYQWKPTPAFHAFEWPFPPTAVFTDMLVKTFPDASAPAAVLAHALASELGKQSGIHVAAPVRLPGAAQTCYRVEARVKLGKSYGAAASYSIIYVYVHDRTTYELIVRGEAGLGGTFQGIADAMARQFDFV